MGPARGLGEMDQRRDHLLLLELEVSHFYWRPRRRRPRRRRAGSRRGRKWPGRFRHYYYHHQPSRREQWKGPLGSSITFGRPAGRDKFQFAPSERLFRRRRAHLGAPRVAQQRRART